MNIQSYNPSSPTRTRFFSPDPVSRILYTNLLTPLIGMPIQDTFILRYNVHEYRLLTIFAVYAGSIGRQPLVYLSNGNLFIVQISIVKPDSFSMLWSPEVILGFEFVVID